LDILCLEGDANLGSVVRAPVGHDWILGLELICALEIWRYGFEFWCDWGKGEEALSGHDKWGNDSDSKSGFIGVNKGEKLATTRLAGTSTITAKSVIETCDDVR
jgi:hypothetical protein